MQQLNARDLRMTWTILLVCFSYFIFVTPGILLSVLVKATKQTCNLNKTGLRPVSRPVEQVQYFRGWVQGAKSHWYWGFADGQTYGTGNRARCMKVGTKVSKTQQTDRQIDEKRNRTGSTLCLWPIVNWLTVWPTDRRKGSGIAVNPEWVCWNVCISGWFCALFHGSLLLGRNNTCTSPMQCGPSWKNDIRRTDKLSTGSIDNF